jgi:serine/threonine protein kinase
VKNSRQGYTSPTKYLQDKSYINHLAVNNKNYFNIGTQLRPIKEYDDENENKINEKMEMNVIFNSNDNVTYANWVYKLTETGKMRKFYLVLVNKDIYYYKSDSKKDFVGMHNLSGCFVQECTEVKNFEGKDYYSFEIYCKNKSKLRKYFAENESICKDFVQQIKKAIGYVKFSDLYEMKEVIGKGKFGVVNLGIHKKTGQQVAIKILNKENIKTLEDKELVQIEIGILKLCHHPNIVRLLDHLENNDYIYIVTEYIEGGTLGQYFKKKKFNFSERQATNIMSQIASGVKYLQQYGIVHRDLKPDNIMITQQNDFGAIKIMDFGLSKILSPNEKMVDGYGTLSYVAPEVLLRTPYNKEVDIWSMGVILFYMLSGKLPFRGRKEQEVAEKIVYSDLEFDEDDWEIRSQSVQDLITRCMEKDAQKRITIDEFINHPWFKKNRKQKMSM